MLKNLNFLAQCQFSTAEHKLKFQIWQIFSLWFACAPFHCLRRHTTALSVAELFVINQNWTGKATEYYLVKWENRQWRVEKSLVKRDYSDDRMCFICQDQTASDYNFWSRRCCIVSLERKKQKLEKQNSDRSSYLFNVTCLHFFNTLPKENLNP